MEFRGDPRRVTSQIRFTLGLMPSQKSPKDSIDIPSVDDDNVLVQALFESMLTNMSYLEKADQQAAQDVPESVKSLYENVSSPHG